MSLLKKYSTLFTLLLVTEIAIAIFHFHRFIRYFIGDVLVIPLLYCLLRACTTLSAKRTLYIVMIVAFTVELAQLLFATQLRGIDHVILRTILGTTFDFRDLLAYTLGVIPILFIEKFRTYGED